MEIKKNAVLLVLLPCTAFWLTVGYQSFFPNFDKGHKILVEKYGENQVNSTYTTSLASKNLSTHLIDTRLTYFQNIVEPNIYVVCSGDDRLSDTIKSFGNAMVIDNNTGLVWRQCPIGQKPIDGKCDAKFAPTMYHYADANEVLTNYSFSGFNDWRLPTLSEISSVYQNRCGKFNISPNIYDPINSGDNYSKDDGDILVDLTAVENNDPSMPDSTTINGLNVILNEVAPRQGAVFLVRGGRGFEAKANDD